MVLDRNHTITGKKDGKKMIFIQEMNLLPCLEIRVVV